MIGDGAASTALTQLRKITGPIDADKAMAFLPSLCLWSTAATGRGGILHPPHARLAQLV